LKIRHPPNFPELGNWWTEGFTDYYARVLSLSAGSLSLENFVEWVNILLREYYQSAARNEPNQYIGNYFFEYHGFTRLAYIRGFTFALFLNDLIKEYTHDQFSLDHVMKDLFTTTQRTKEPFSSELFNTHVSRYIPRGIEDELQRYIVNGKTIDLSSLAHRLPITFVELHPVELGFSLKTLLDDGIVKDLNVNSNAYKAGLREGQHVVKRGPWPMFPEKSTWLLLDNGTKIEFIPQGQGTMSVPQLTPSSEQDRNILLKWFS